MKTILIMSKDGLFPTKEQESLIRKNSDLEIIIHEGKLSGLKKFKNDLSEKLLAVDPDSFGWDMDSESIGNIPNVKAVFTQSTSYDWVKPDVLRKMGIKVVNCAGFSTDAVAEYAIGMALDIARHVPLIIKNDWKVDWSAPKPMLLKGKTLGVIGLGKIGSRVAELGKGIGMEVLYWSKNSRDNRFKYVSIEKLFKMSDVIIPTLSENKNTENILKDSLLKLVKKTSYLVGINRIRGLWNEDMIIKMVESGKIAGYAFEGEGAKNINEYKGNILALPAMVWYTQDSLDNLLNVWVENIVKFAKGKPQNIVV